jgi:hydroxyacylglutathione hydrolase
MENGMLPRVVVLKTHYQFMKNYNYLVVEPNRRQAVIVDPAWEMGTIDQALACAQARLRGILITHSHTDHVDLAEPLAEKYDCPIWMSEREIALSGFSGRRVRGIRENPWVVAGMSIEAIFTPGHTPGSTCYLIGDNLFTGDVLFAEGCGICPDTRAAHAMFASLQTLKARLGPQTHIFPGHSYGEPPGQVMSQLLRDNIYLQFTDKDSFAAFRMRRNQDLARMFSFS